MQLLNKASALAADLKIEAEKSGKDAAEPEKIMSMIGSYDGMKGKLVTQLFTKIKRNYCLIKLIPNTSLSLDKCRKRDLQEAQVGMYFFRSK